MSIIGTGGVLCLLLLQYQAGSRPQPLIIAVERLRSYFATYKLRPGTKDPVIVKGNLDCEQALRAVEASIRDYDETFAIAG